MKHYVQLGSICFAEQRQESRFAPELITVTARCTCGLQYELTAEDMVKASEELRASVLRHLSEMQQQGEETDSWPF